MGAEKVENLEVKGSYRQSRQVLHYKLEHMAKVLGPVRDFMAGFQNPRLLEDALLPLEDVKDFLWLRHGRFKRTRSNPAVGQPAVVGYLEFGQPGDAVGVGSWVRH